MTPRVAMVMLVWFAFASEGCHGWASYRSKIPNGFHVPDDDGDGTWGAVGHVTADGGTDLNAFGHAFERENEWTKALCEEDSDGDGFSNGVELGDPTCVWEEGSLPTHDGDVSNPGLASSIPAFARRQRRQPQAEGDDDEL